MISKTVDKNIKCYFLKVKYSIYCSANKQRIAFLHTTKSDHQNEMAFVFAQRNISLNTSCKCSISKFNLKANSESQRITFKALKYCKTQKLTAEACFEIYKIIIFASVLTFMEVSSGFFRGHAWLDDIKF